MVSWFVTRFVKHQVLSEVMRNNEKNPHINDKALHIIMTIWSCKFKLLLTNKLGVHVHYYMIWISHRRKQRKCSRAYFIEIYENLRWSQVCNSDVSVCYVVTCICRGRISSVTRLFSSIARYTVIAEYLPQRLEDPLVTYS